MVNDSHKELFRGAGIERERMLRDDASIRNDAVLVSCSLRWFEVRMTSRQGVLSACLNNSLKYEVGHTYDSRSGSI